jgi:hypothetical protein
MDAMSAAIGKPQKSRKVYTIAGSKAAMADVGRSCSRKSKPRERKMRSVKMLAVGSSDEPCCAYTIKQRTCIKAEWLKFQNLTQNCDHYFMFVPARPRKAELRALLRKEDERKKLLASSAVQATGAAGAAVGGTYIY